MALSHPDPIAAPRQGWPPLLPWPVLLVAKRPTALLRAEINAWVNEGGRGDDQEA